MLDPYSLAGVPVVGSDVFKFLGQHSSAIGRDFKQRVRAALKAGLALSLDLHLRTRRAIVFRGDEKFATHWTPLKDEAGRVNWVVLTMASASVA